MVVETVELFDGMDSAMRHSPNVDSERIDKVHKGISRTQEVKNAYLGYCNMLRSMCKVEADACGTLEGACEL